MLNAPWLAFRPAARRRAHLLPLDAKAARRFHTRAIDSAAFVGLSGSPHDLADIRQKEAAYALAFMRAREIVAELVEAGGDYSESEPL